jgi:hypothetical protein
MKLFIAATTLAVSVFSLASSVVNGDGAIATVRANGGTTTVSADLLHRLLFSMDEVDTEEELKEVLTYGRTKESLLFE